MAKHSWLLRACAIGLILAWMLAPLAAWSLAQTHTVVAGDTLFGIAARYDTDIANLRTLNNLSTSTIRVGQVLQVPGRGDSSLLAGYPSSFQVHVLAAGDSLESVARRYRVSAQSLREVNQEADFGNLPAGRSIRIPPSSGFMTQVSARESLLDIAVKYGLAPMDIAHANDLRSLAVAEGQTIFVPLTGNPPDLATDLATSPAVVSDATAAAPPFAAPATSRRQTSSPPDTARERRAHLLAQQEQWLSRASHLLANYEPPSSIFSYPLARRSPLSSPYGWRYLDITGRRFHHGIDLAAPTGMAVLASKAGRVSRAGSIGSYGNAVYIDHVDGTQTRYAHMSRLAVSSGAYVSQSEVIGYVGSTGLSTGPHLHFELRVNGYSVNPREYLDF